jgi:hypothetical protein
MICKASLVKRSSGSTFGWRSHEGAHGGVEHYQIFPKLSSQPITWQGYIGTLYLKRGGFQPWFKIAGY